MNQNANISQVSQPALPIPPAEELTRGFDKQGISLKASSFSATIEEVSCLICGCTKLTGHSIKLTSCGLINIAQILLIKIERFVDDVQKKFPNNEDFKNISDLIFYLTVALHDLKVTTLNDELKSNLAYGISVVAEDFDQLIQSIPALLDSIAKESANV